MKRRVRRWLIARLAPYITVRLDTYTVSDTWTKPAGAIVVHVLAQVGGPVNVITIGAK